MTEQEIAERTAAWVAESLESYSIWLCERLSLLAFAAEEDPAAGALYAAVLDTFEGEIRSRQYERRRLGRRR